jgi:hypothetical protein
LQLCDGAGHCRLQSMSTCAPHRPRQRGLVLQSYPHPLIREIVLCSTLHNQFATARRPEGRPKKELL